MKLKASDGIYYNTDVCDIEGMFRLIQSIPSKNAEPFKKLDYKYSEQKLIKNKQ